MTTKVKELRAIWNEAKIGKTLTDSYQITAFMKSIWTNKNVDCQREALQLILLCKKPQILEMLVLKKLPLLLKVWLRECIQVGDQRELVSLALTVLAKLPLSLENVHDLSKVIKHLSSKHIDDSVKKQAELLLASWTKQQSDSIREPVKQPVNASVQTVKAPDVKKPQFAEVDIFNDLEILNSNPQPKKKLRPNGNSVPFGQTSVSATQSRSTSGESLNSVKSSDIQLVQSGKKKKTVRWRPDNELEQILVFESYTDEHRKLANARQLDRQEGLNMKQAHLHNHEEQVWREPAPLEFGGQPLVSKELIEELERVKNVLSVAYFDGMTVAESPSEPVKLEVNDDSAAVSIPMYSSQVTKQNALPEVNSGQVIGSFQGNPNFAQLLQQFPLPQQQQQQVMYQQPNAYVAQYQQQYQPGYYIPIQQQPNAQQYTAFQAYQQPPTYIQQIPQPQSQYQQQPQQDTKRLRKK